jgi:YesN/AraC family two-component response regulator
MFEGIPIQTEASVSADSLRLLIADDEQIIRQKIRELGERLGFEVSTAGNGQEALDKFKQFNPHLVLLDIYMPHGNGLEAMIKIKEINPRCPVILITGFLHYEQLIEQGSVKPDGFIIKPFHVGKVADLMLRLVKESPVVEG